MNPLAVEDLSANSFSIGAKEHASGKDTLESLDEAAVANTVLWKLQELKQLSGSFEVNGSALLLHCQRRDPDRNQAVKTEGQTISRMSDDLKKKFPVLTTMN